jgi:heme A synthase
VLSFLSFLHARFGVALLIFAAVLGLLGAFQLLSRRQVGGGFRSGFLLLWGLTVLQGLIGAGTFIEGARPHPLHFVYGLFALLFLPGVYVYAGDRRKDTEAMLLTIACWVVAIAYGRGIMTGR